MNLCWLWSQAGFTCNEPKILSYILLMFTCMTKRCVLSPVLQGWICLCHILLGNHCSAVRTFCSRAGSYPSCTRVPDVFPCGNKDLGRLSCEEAVTWYFQAGNQSSHCNEVLLEIQPHPFASRIIPRCTALK